MFIIENNVPAPSEWDKGKTKPFKYPFLDMKPGDSFFIEEYSYAKQAGIKSAANRFVERRKLDWRFTTRKEGSGLRVWRIS